MVQYQYYNVLLFERTTHDRCKASATKPSGGSAATVSSVKANYQSQEGVGSDYAESFLDFFRMLEFL